MPLFKKVYDFQIMNDRFSLFDDGFKKRGRMDGNFIFPP